MKMHLFISTLLLLFLLTGCSTLFGDRLKLSKTSYSDLDGWSKDDQRQAMLAFKKSCEKYQAMPKERYLHVTKLGGTYAHWQELCNKVDDYANPKDFFESNFTPYSVRNWWTKNGLFTGYYETVLKGSRTKKFPYIYPVYKTPKDLIAKQKYYSRAEIDSGALEGRGLEILWVDDPIELFFTQIQGSGRVKMDDGSLVRIGYAGQNGYEYFAIGKYLIDQKFIEKKKISKTAIVEWLRQHPDNMQEVLEKNPSYVFFRELNGDGPIGAQGVALTPNCSIAIDKKFIPYGVPLWLDASVNGGDAEEDKQIFQKLLIAQDTGGAIKGPVRGDIFFGYGNSAEKIASYQNSKGRYYILLPNVIE